ncbi:trehalose-phosphatase [Salegentibacter chungangensis]|uniref:Trehalose 6-phosphate phosphatase n=1 Tax=Salegentibacter chungangensis TaxID=1335724 RepID=A0ABW3NMG2_9FLAO
MEYSVKAGIFDLDGVITKTARQHAKAWKRMFDEYNEEREDSGKEPFKSFSIEEDYPKYVDGIPRYDGVREFLRSRNIDLPKGSPDDDPHRETICGLGNRKNRLLLEIIKDEGVEVFRKNINQIKQWKADGLRIAVISSSKNCRQILQSTGLEDMFEARVDGVVSQERNIKGKPEPDIFLEAAKELGVSPEEAMIVEDAIAGTQAGKKGNFKLVTGIINGATKEELLQNGADIAVNSLEEVNLKIKNLRSPAALPSAVKNIEQLKSRFKEHKPLFFLDFDGTLAPIVTHHQDAAMDPEMKNIVEKLASEYKIAVISGRGLSDVKKRVGLENIYYAGSHGFEISGPGNFSKDNEEAKKILPVFEKTEPVLKERLKHIQGVEFERKKFTLAIHYRQAAGSAEEEVHRITEEVLAKHKQLKIGEGKKVIEIRPNLEWDKGKAVEILKMKIGNSETAAYSVYIGDDVTDEDAFETLENGLGILVGDHGKETYADFRLKDVEEVKEFLSKLL